MKSSIRFERKSELFKYATVEIKDANGTDVTVDVAYDFSGVNVVCPDGEIGAIISSITVYSIQPRFSKPGKYVFDPKTLEQIKAILYELPIS